MSVQVVLNDPAIPSLLRNMEIPELKPGLPKFAVDGFTGHGELWSHEWQSSQVHVTLVNSMNHYQPITPKAFTRWQATKILKVHPRAGEDFNAFYDRQSLQFFYGTDPVAKSVVYACNSVDVVAHELGHAILDSMRPDLWNCPVVEAWGFHESFGDMNAMMSTMQYDEVLTLMLSQTNNTISTSNVVSRLAEQLGRAIYNLYEMNGNNNGQRPDSLREAINNYAYVTPNRLPKNTPDNKLSSEPHNFSRVFTGTFYDILVGVFNKQITGGRDPMTALKASRDYCSYLLAQAITGAPLVPQFYQSVARAMLQIDKNIGSPNQDVLNWAFARRKIIRPAITALSNTHINDINKDNFEVEETESHVILRKSKITTMKIADHVQALAQDNDPLYKAEIEVPAQVYMKFDKSGHLIEEIAPKRQAIIDSLRLAVSHIKKLDLVDRDGGNSKQFKIEDGQLKRNFIKCKCCNH